MQNKIGTYIIIGIALYFIFKKKKETQYISKAGARLRKLPNTTSVILKTFSVPTELKFVKVQKENDGNWYLVQELWEKGSVASDGTDISGNVKWTGWLREDVINII